MTAAEDQAAVAEETAATLIEASARQAEIDLVGKGRWQTFVSRVSTAAAIMAGLGFFLLMLLTLADVTLRGATGRGIIASLDIVELAMPGLIFLALASTELSGTNIRTPILTARMKSGPANLSRAIAQTLAAGFIAWMAYALLVKSIVSVATLESRFALVAVPVWTGRVVMVVGCFLFLVVLVTEAWRSWQRVVRREPAMLQEMEAMP